MKQCLFGIGVLHTDTQEHFNAVTTSQHTPAVAQCSMAESVRKSLQSIVPILGNVRYLWKAFICQKSLFKTKTINNETVYHSCIVAILFTGVAE